MRAGVRRFQRVFANRAGFWVDAAELVASWPVHHIEPSFAASGSCGREPCVGTSHKSMRALTGPDRITADGRARSGKFFMRYSVIAGHSSGATGVSKFCIMRTTVSQPFGV